MIVVTVKKDNNYKNALSWSNLNILNGPEPQCMHADHVNKSEIKIRTIHRRNKLFGLVRLSNWRRILNHVFKAFKAGFLVEYIMLEVSTVIGCYMGKMSSLQFLNEKN